MYIVKIEADARGFHLFQSQSHREECWLDGYIEVPQELESVVIECKGYCDLVIENDILKNVIARPDLIPIKETHPTEIEQLRADIDFLAVMTEVEL